MTLLDIVWVLITGIVIGWLAGVLARGGGFGVLGNLAVGLVGSAVGGLIFPAIGLGAVTSGGRLLQAVGGAILLVVVIRLVTGARQKHAHG